MIWPFRSRRDADLLRQARERMREQQGELLNCRAVIESQRQEISRLTGMVQDRTREMWAVFRHSGQRRISVPMEELRSNRPVVPSGMSRDIDYRLNVMNYTNMEVSSEGFKYREEYRGEAKAAPAERREAGGGASTPVIPFTGRLVPRQHHAEEGCGDRGRDDDADL